MIILEEVLDVLGIIINNLFLSPYSNCLDALARDESVHFCFNSCSLLCDSKTGVTSNPFPPSLVRDWQK